MSVPWPRQQRTHGSVGVDGDTQAMNGVPVTMRVMALFQRPALTAKALSPHQRACRSRKVERTGVAPAVEEGTRTPTGAA